MVIQATAILILVMLAPGERSDQSLPPPPQVEQERILTTWSGAITDTAGIFYLPVSEHFRLRYELDQRNRNRQRWNRYWGWIKTFYAGNILARGWTEQCGRILEALPADYEREALIGRMNVLGRLIAAEWAKDNNVRVIATSDLQRWGGQMRRAMRRRNQADPAPIIDLFSEIERTVHRRISPLYNR
ncbi:hypothetical protein ACFL6R_03995 [Gemmatimonadota bacterium]